MDRLSIIIPTLNEEAALLPTLTRVCAVAPDCEILVVDGGSTDRTQEIAAAFSGRGVKWLESERGRGVQMNSGVNACTGGAIVFLHADTLLPAGAPEMILGALKDPRVVGGNFRVRFEPRGVMADLYTHCYNARSRLKVFYGDSAIFVRRSVFREVGGYRHARIMEDLELVRRLRRAGKVRTISDGEVISSARRFESVASGLRALMLWSWLHLLFYAGASQEALERRYPLVR